MTETDMLEVPDDGFYHIQVNGDEALFKSQQGAIEYLRERKDDIDLENPDVQLARVETGDEWAIEGLPWQNIALQLL